MFQVRQNKTCDVTGVTSLFIEFNIGYGHRTDKRNYTSREDADFYVRSCEKTYILSVFEKYVRDAVSFMEEGTKNWVKTPARLESLDRCRKTNVWFNSQERDIQVILSWVLKLERDLILILPSSSSGIKDSMEGRLRDMIVFAKSRTSFRANHREPVEIN